MLNIEKTVISQYSATSKIRAIGGSFNAALDPRALFLQFVKDYWDIDTATAIGLDYWGRILGISRYLAVERSEECFGFDTPLKEWYGFDAPGAPYCEGDALTDSVRIDDDYYRRLLKAKALANITPTTAKNVNAILRAIIDPAGRVGNVYVKDNLDMSIEYVSDYTLTPFETALIKSPGLLPKPAGVGVGALVPVAAANDCFGFDTPLKEWQPWDQGVFCDDAAANVAPVAVNDTIVTIADTAVSANLLTNDTDANGDTLTLTDFNWNNTMSSLAGATQTIAGIGTVTITAAGLLTFTPVTGYVGAVPSCTYTIQDVAGLTSTATITFTNVSSGTPTATAQALAGTEDTTTTFTLAGTDPDGTVASFTITTLPTASQGIIYLADGVTPITAGQVLTPAQATGLKFIPTLNYNGTVTIPFTVTDNAGNVSAVANVVITVAAVNDAPVAVDNAVTTVFNTPVSVNVLTNDTDPDAADTLTVVSFSWNGL